MTEPAFLSVEGVSKSYGAMKVTDDLSFSIRDGEALGIIGPNGAGKTTLFNLIGGGAKPDAGRILFRGEDITSLRAAAALSPWDRPILSNPASVRQNDSI